MTTDATELFLRQFELSREGVEAWPDWMKNNPMIVTVTLPKAQRNTVIVSGDKNGEKRQDANDTFDVK